MSRIRLPFKPEATSVSGSGADFWRQPDDNDFEPLDEDRLRSKGSIRQQFLAKQRASIAARRAGPPKAK